MSLRESRFSMRLILPLLSIAIALGTAAVLSVVDAAADATPSVTPAKPAGETGDKTTKPGRPARELPAFTAEREAAALTFVSAHHPELAPLLVGLKSSRPQEYQRAVRKLFADSERLAQSQEAQPKQYELKLREWKLESRIQLLVARLTMDRTPVLETELRSALEEQLLVHRELLMHDRDRLQQKVTGLDREITKIDADREAAVTERFNRALTSAGQKKSGLKSNRGDEKSSEAKNAETKKSTP